MTDPDDLTLAAYQAATDRYIENSGPMSPAVAGYLEQVVAAVGDGHVLELGSGPGREADYLEHRGLRVSRTDATPAFVDRLRALGHDAQLLDARTADLGGPYDGVFAFAVLLHLSRMQFEDVLARAREAVGDSGVLAVTLKEGDGEEWTEAKLGQPRHFTYWREPDVRAVLTRTEWTVASLEHVPGRNGEQWLFVVARAAPSGPHSSGGTARPARQMEPR